MASTNDLEAIVSLSLGAYCKGHRGNAGGLSGSYTAAVNTTPDD